MQASLKRVRISGAVGKASKYLFVGNRNQTQSLVVFNLFMRINYDQEVFCT